MATSSNGNSYRNGSTHTHKASPKVDTHGHKLSPSTLILVPRKFMPSSTTQHCNSTTPKDDASEEELKETFNSFDKDQNGFISATDVEIPMSCMEKWDALYEEYRKDMINACSKMRSNMRQLKSLKFVSKSTFQMEDSLEDINNIYNEALAGYHVTYDYAIQMNSIGRCGLAWKVASSALMSL